MSNLEEIQGTIENLNLSTQQGEASRNLKDVKDFLVWKTECEKVLLKSGNDIHCLTMRMCQVKEQEKKYLCHSRLV